MPDLLNMYPEVLWVMLFMTKSIMPEKLSLTGALMKADLTQNSYVHLKMQCT